MLYLAFVTTVTVTAGLVGTATYLASRSTLDTAWQGLAAAQVDHLTEQTLRLLDPATTMVRFGERMMDEGELDPLQHEEMLDFLVRGLDTYPDLSWMTYARNDGVYYLAFQDREGDHRTVRKFIVLPGERGDWVLHKQERGADGEWQQIGTEPWPIDARERPYYKAGSPLAEGEGVWTDPYVFLVNGQLGISYAMPSRADDDTLRGVWTADVEATPLSHFLGNLRLPATGRAYITDQRGVVIGHPDGTVVDRQSRPVRTMIAEQHPDARLSRAWKAVEARGELELAELVGTDLVAARKFPPASGVPWHIVMVVDEGELYRDARRQLILASTLATILVLLGLALASWYARRLTLPLSVLEGAMLRVARFDLDGPDLGLQNGTVREFNALEQAHDAMKRGLRSFGRYVPRQLVEQLLLDGDEATLGAESKDVSVLFLDVEGFTTLAERSSHEQMMSALSEFMQTAQEGVAEHEGVVGTFLGDALMAFWGAPRPHARHAEAACAAALAIHERTCRAAVEAELAGKPVIRLRFGVNSGSALAGNIGASERFVYTLLGDPVNLASRLEGLNKHFGTSILIGDATARIVQESFLVRPVADVRVKGREQVTRVWELMGHRLRVPVQVTEALVQTGDALDALREGEVDNAVELLEEVVQRLGPADRVAARQLERARALLGEKPRTADFGVLDFDAS